MASHPRLFVVAAPSGAGKSTLVNALLAREPRLRLSVSHTTRPMRPTEQHGREYYFTPVEDFRRMADAGAFVEHAQVFDNFYGTSKAQLAEKLAAGHDVVLEIDWQGARQIRAAMPDCAGIFILPPSRVALETRLRNRRTDSDAVIARRLRDAVSDMAHYREFDYVVVNDRFEQAVEDLRAIVTGDPRAAGLRGSRASLGPLLAELLAD
jgi:guanylate kinase